MLFSRFTSFVGVCLCSMTVFAAAQDIPDSKKTKLSLYLTSADANTLLQDPDTVFVDVRTRAEVAFLGIPEEVDIHIPYMTMPMVPEFDAEKGTYALEINPDFPLVFRAWAEERGVGKDTAIVLMCRSGSRSARAANLLADLGYTQVYSLIDGFEGDKAKEGLHKGERVVNGWKNTGLAWSYKARADQVYPEDR